VTIARVASRRAAPPSLNRAAAIKRPALKRYLFPLCFALRYVKSSSASLPPSLPPSSPIVPDRSSRIEMHDASEIHRHTTHD